MELKKVKGKTYGKGRDKRNVKSENVNLRKKTGHNRGPPQQTYC